MEADITVYEVQIVPGTGSINVNLAEEPPATGIPTSAGAAIVAVSSIPGGSPQGTGGLPNLGNILLFPPLLTFRYIFIGGRSRR
jgi:hypothetical protein